MDNLSDFHGPNAGYILELYDRYRRDPTTVDAATRTYFEHWQPSAPESHVNGTAAAMMPSRETQLDMNKVASAANLAQAIREYGHLAAHLDPLGTPSPGDPSLDPAYYGITDDDLRRLPASIIGGPLAEQTETAWGSDSTATSGVLNQHWL